MKTLNRIIFLQILPVCLLVSTAGCSDDSTGTNNNVDAGDASVADGGDAQSADGGDGGAPEDYVLKYLGTYECQPGPDHLLGVAVLDADRLLVASPINLAVVDRPAVESGTVTTPMFALPSEMDATPNLDGAPTGSTYFPMLFEIALYGMNAYVTTRWEGLYVMRINGSGPSTTVERVRRILTPREFTENAQVLGDRLYLTHHRDGIEVMDLQPDPENPVSVARLQSGLTDSWGVAAQDNGDIWVADGAGGVKLVRFQSANTLEIAAGDTLQSSPGTMFDVGVVGNRVLAAAGGRGLAVYDPSNASFLSLHPLDGVCVDLAPMAANRAAVACRPWVHVVEVDSNGELRTLASARMHRRATADPGRPSVHMAHKVAVAGDVLYVGAWDHLDSYRLVTEDPDADPDIWVGEQYVHFGTQGQTTISIHNAGQGDLTISEVEELNAQGAVTCTADPMTLAPGQSGTLTVSYSGTPADVNATCNILSDDIDDPAVPVLVHASLAANVDPLETAPLFTGSFTVWDYGAGTSSATPFALADFDTSNEVVHFAIFGSW